ncbi:TPA: hypothetical protein ACS773_002122 [Providencia alcalifaciens]
MQGTNWVKCSDSMPNIGDTVKLKDENGVIDGEFYLASTNFKSIHIWHPKVGTKRPWMHIDEATHWAVPEGE